MSGAPQEPALRAALSLLDAQHPAEGLRLARTALAAARARVPGETQHAIDDFLARPAGRMDREVTPGELSAARDALEGVLERGPETARARAWVAALGAVVAAVACTVNALRPPPAVSARASGVYADLPGYGATRAIDGDPETSWLLPDDSAGSIAVRFATPRRVERVRLSNARNGVYDDRASHAYVLEAWSGGRVVATERGSFEWAARSEPHEHVLGLDGVDRVRVHVESWHRRGGGLAEIEVE